MTMYVQGCDNCCRTGTTLEMWCPARGCGFESRALRFRKLRPRLELRGLLSALCIAREGDFTAQCSQYVANLGMSAQRTWGNDGIRLRTSNLNTAANNGGRVQTAADAGNAVSCLAN